MEDKNIHIVHQYLNKEITIDDLQKQLSVEEFDYWKDTLSIVDELPKPVFNTQQEYYKLLQKRQSKQKSSWKIKYAAAIILMFFSSWLVINFLNDTTDSVTISYQNSKKNNMFYLPDSSKVYLNKGASIAYEVSQWKSKREVQLKGEAYFDVKKGQKFLVTTKNGSVEVLGTTFNVIDQNNLFLVTCYTGKVAVKQGDYKVILYPKDAYTSVNNKLSKVNVDLPPFMSKWSMFEKAPLTDVVKNIAAIKKVSINIDLDSTYFYTGGFSNDMTTEDILNLICKTLDLSYTVIDQNHYEIKNSSKP